MNKPNMTYSISKDEIKQFSMMLEHGVDTRTVISIVFKNKNEIIRDLENGKNLIDIFVYKQKDMFFRYIDKIGRFTNLKKTIKCVEKIEDSSTSIVKSILIKISYPFFLMLFALGMIIFFSDYVLQEMSYYLDGSNLLSWVCVLKYIFLIIVFCIGMYLIVLYLMLYWYSKFRTFLNLFLNKNIFKRINTLQFVCIFQCLIENGLSTMDVLNIISDMDFSVCGYIGKKLISNLENGYSFEKSIEVISFIDDDLKKILTYAYESNQMDVFLKLYIDKCKNDIDLYIKKVSVYIQILSYSSIGVLVLIVYQVMLLPLNMLNQF